MSNPLFEELGGSRMPNNDMTNFMQQVIQFKNQMGNIDPREKIMQCLTNGMIDQRTLNMYQSFANQLMK